MNKKKESTTQCAIVNVRSKVDWQSA